MRARLGLFSYGLLLLAACRDDRVHAASDGPGRPPEPHPEQQRSPAEFCSDWAKGACSEEAVRNCQASSTEACRASQERFCLGQFERRLFSDRHGRACTDAVAKAYEDGQLRDLELSIVLKLAGPCDRVLSGPHGRGQQCKEPSDCERHEDFDCVRKGSDTNGTCQKPQQARAGRDCKAAHLICEPGFHCDGEHCIEVAGVGEPCKIHEQCGADAYCSAERCTARKGTNEVCSADVECGAGICDCFEGKCDHVEGKRVCTDRIVLSRAEPICDRLK